ncbi:MAG: leucine-rich repeat domain-containing protein [Holosporales bacterium]|jgi:hypothetical protein|nr:leucine-rich repeat domain-containing protein [Holosporales bacterium]
MKAFLKLALLSASSVFSVNYACAAEGAEHVAALKPKLGTSKSVAVPLQTSGGPSATPYTIPPDVTEIVDGMFRHKYDTPSITIPASVKIIGEKAFSGCSLQQVILQEGLTEIGKFAFSGCWLLQSINIPASVTTIKEDAFFNCKGLAAVNFATDSNLKEIGADAFNGCSNLKQIVIPASVQRIGERISNGRMTITLSKGSLSSLYDNGKCSDETLCNLLKRLFDTYNVQNVIGSKVILISPLGETIECESTGAETVDYCTTLQWQCSRNGAAPYTLELSDPVICDALWTNFN